MDPPSWVSTWCPQSYRPWAISCPYLWLLARVPRPGAWVQALSVWSSAPLPAGVGGIETSLCCTPLPPSPVRAVAHGHQDRGSEPSPPPLQKTRPSLQAPPCSQLLCLTPWSINGHLPWFP